MSLSRLQRQYQSALDEVNRIREAHDGSVPADAMPELIAAKDRMQEAHNAYSRAWDAAIAAAPKDLTIDATTGRITIMQSVGDGAKCRYVSRGDAGYDAAMAEIESRRAVDARVAEAAFAAWDWRGSVRIDYYGDSARVTNGGKSITIRLAALQL